MAAPEASTPARPDAAQSLTARLGQAVWDRRHPEWATDVPGETRPRLHLTAAGVPRYLVDRATARAQGRRRPWLTAEATALLEDLLKPTDRVLEWGSGRTTRWFSARAGSVESVETSRQWHRTVRTELARARRHNVRLHLVARDDYPDVAAHREAYVRVSPDLTPGSLDVALVDAEHRDHCALRAVELLAPGWVLVLDNATTYLPARTRSPWRVTEPATAAWADFVERVREWRCVWTTNGVWDTAIWLKP